MAGLTWGVVVQWRAQPLRELASSVDALSRSVGTGVSELEALLPRTAQAWRVSPHASPSSAGEMATQHLKDVIEDGGLLRRDVVGLVDVLQAAANDVSRMESEVADVVALARANELAISAAGTVQDVAPVRTFVTELEADLDLRRRERAIEQCVRDMESVLTLAAWLDERLSQVFSSLTTPRVPPAVSVGPMSPFRPILPTPPVKPPLRELTDGVGLTPDESLGPAAYPFWGINGGSLVSGSTAEWATKMRYGRFAYREGGRYASTAGLSPWELGRAMADDSNWQSRPGVKVPRERWLKVGKVAGRAGVVAAGAQGGYQQWQESAQDPTATTAERVTDTAIHAGIVGGGAWAGAVMGAEFGAELGGGLVFMATLVFPPAAAAAPVVVTVGAILGGVAGGFFGSQKGETVAEYGVEFKNWVIDRVSSTASPDVELVGP